MIFHAPFVLPEMNELSFAHSFGIFVAGMMEAMNAHLYGSVALHVVDLQRSGNKFPGHPLFASAGVQV